VRYGTVKTSALVSELPEPGVELPEPAKTTEPPSAGAEGGWPGRYASCGSGAVELVLEGIAAALQREPGRVAATRRPAEGDKDERTADPAVSHRHFPYRCVLR
jgi:hypothetical protein